MAATKTKRRRPRPRRDHLKVDHLEGCPDEERLETFEQIRPARPAAGQPARIVTVTRCIECGEQKTRVGGAVDVGVAAVPDEEGSDGEEDST